MIGTIATILGSIAGLAGSTLLGDVIGGTGELIKGKMLGNVSEKESFNYTKKMNNKMLDREERWRAEDIARNESYRELDYLRSTPQHRMEQFKEAGLHPHLAVGASMGGGTGGGFTQPTGAGGRISAPPSGQLRAANAIEQAEIFMNMKAAAANIRKTNAEATEIENETTAWDQVIPGEELTYRQKAIAQEHGMSEYELKEFNAVIKRLEHDNKILLKNPNLLTDSRDVEHMVNDLKRQMDALNIVEYTADKILDVIGKIMSAGADQRANRQIPYQRTSPQQRQQRGR